jgi:hypothetical protein
VWSGYAHLESSFPALAVGLRVQVQDVQEIQLNLFVPFDTNVNANADDGVGRPQAHTLQLRAHIWPSEFDTVARYSGTPSLDGMKEKQKEEEKKEKKEKEEVEEEQEEKQTLRHKSKHQEQVEQVKTREHLHATDGSDDSADAASDISAASADIDFVCAQLPGADTKTFTKKACEQVAV